MSNDWVTRGIILGLLGVVLGVPFLVRPKDEVHGRANVGNSELRLIVVTPHNEQIRYEFGRAFNAHRIAEGKPAIEFDWRTPGGSSDIRKQLISEYTKAGIEEREAEGSGKDLMFGGGDFEHNRLAQGIKVTRRDGSEAHIAIFQPIQIPESLLKEIFPEPTIGGVPLYHKDMLWVGPVLSSFGIVYNRDVIRRIGANEPTTWADMRHRTMYRWIALADPSHSSSIAVTYNTILRRYGWTEGWVILREVFGNARYFTSSASKVPTDVSSGESAAGMCIDFYGRFQAGAIGDDRLGYVDPAGMTAITPDPIAILAGAPNRELANEFVLWLLSVEGQKLWQRRIGTEGGPLKFELRRLPVRQDLYTPDEVALWADHSMPSPFAIAKPLPKRSTDFYSAVAPLVHAMAIDVHSELQAATYAIHNSASHPRYAEMLSLYHALPDELRLTWPDEELATNSTAILADESHPRHQEAHDITEAFYKALADNYGGWRDRDKLLSARLQWTLFFQQNYRQIVRLSRE